MANQPKEAVRPLSPHLQIYRWQVPMLTSILTRITGNTLIVSTIMVVWWLVSAASGAEYYELANAIITSFFGDIIMTLSLLGIWYHFLAGLRHVYYDAGKGLDIPTAELLGWGCLIGSVVLTIITILLV